MSSYDEAAKAQVARIMEARRKREEAKMNLKPPVAHGETPPESHLLEVKVGETTGVKVDETTGTTTTNNIKVNENTSTTTTKTDNVSFKKRSFEKFWNDERCYEASLTQGGSESNSGIVEDEANDKKKKNENPPPPPGDGENRKKANGSKEESQLDCETKTKRPVSTTNPLKVEFLFFQVILYIFKQSGLQTNSGAISSIRTKLYKLDLENFNGKFKTYFEQMAGLFNELNNECTVKVQFNSEAVFYAQQIAELEGVEQFVLMYDKKEAPENKIVEPPNIERSEVERFVSVSQLMHLTDNNEKRAKRETKTTNANRGSDDM